MLNGLTLNGMALVGNPTNGRSGVINFAGTQTLAGSGAVVFGNNQTYSGGCVNTLAMSAAGTTLTIGAGITVRGQNGVIRYNSTFGWPQNVYVIDQGTIACDISGGTITVSGQSFGNQGLLACSNGGRLSVEDLVGEWGRCRWRRAAG